MPEKNFYHEDGVLYQDEIPRLVTYGKIFDLDFSVKPSEQHSENVDVYLEEGNQMRHVTEVEDFKWKKGGGYWSPENPIEVSYTVDTSFDNLSEIDLFNSDVLESFLNSEMKDTLEESPEELYREITDQFEFRDRNRFLDRERFLEEKEGVCDQFSELMALADPNWIKHEGYARPGDPDLTNGEKRFGNHAWVVDTENQKVYDPTIVVSGKVPPEEERNPKNYFIRLPNIKVSVDGEEIGRKIHRKDGSTDVNYELEAKLS
jgi:hypothetical protein